MACLLTTGSSHRPPRASNGTASACWVASALADVLVDGVRDTGEVDVAAGVDPASVSGAAAVETGEDAALGVEDADAGGAAVDLALADQEVALVVTGDVHGALDIVPELDELPVEGEELDAVVLAVADDDAVAVDDQAVGQVKVVGLGLAGLAPRLDQLALGGEAVDPGVAVAVGDVELAEGDGTSSAG